VYLKYNIISEMQRKT